MSGRLLLLIDGDCAVCRASRRWVERHTAPGSVEVVPNIAEVARRSGISKEDLDQQVWVIDADGRRFGGAAAANRVLRETSWGWRRLAALYSVPPIGWLEDWLYAWVAARRGKLFGRFFND